MPPWAQRLWSLIRQLQGALDGKTIRSGTATLTWPGGSQTTSVATVTHGLPATPTEVVATAKNPPVDAWVWTGTPGATTVDLAARTSAAAPAGGTTVTVSWIAIG
jgi:hypothetical protein